MATMTECAVKAGRSVGDGKAAAYVYVPASELGVDKPLGGYEQGEDREDVDLREAMAIIRRRSLRHAVHPRLGSNSC